MVGSTRSDVADEAELLGALLGGDQVGVLAREPDRQRRVHVDGRDDLPVDLAHEHHAGDVEGLGVGDPQPVAELGVLAEAAASARRSGVRRRAPPPAACPTERRSTTSWANVARAAPLGRRSPSPAAAAASALPPYLTTTTVAGELPDVGQRLDQQRGDRRRVAPAGRAHEVVRFSSM